MKRLMAVIPMILMLSVLYPTPSSALFGLSKCEKVKKNIVNLEEKINVFARSVAKHPKKELPERVYLDIRAFNDQNYLSEIWKLAYNNPSCFTNTQKLRIKEIKKESLYDYVAAYDAGKRVKEGICKDMEFYFLSENCIQVHRYEISNLFTIRSIYKY